jgi:glutamate/tyrosine decarboxylase-like PLP-dependent enzyme
MPKRAFALGAAGSEALGAWFIGPVGENGEQLRERVTQIIDAHLAARKDAYPNDPAWATKKVQESPSYRKATALLQENVALLLERLGRSVPFYSYRYQGHMLWDISLPAAVGYLAAMLSNQNNVAAEASPVTTELEVEVAKDLCRMLGYPEAAWGHLTCGGSVANIEALWAARNLKAFPLALAAALDGEPSLKAGQELDVELADGTRKPLLEMTSWELLNVKADDVLDLPRRLDEERGVPTTARDDLKRHMLADLGFGRFVEEHPDSNFAALRAMCPATCHYSWPKAASLLGLGEAGIVRVAVDLDARLDVDDLRRHLRRCLAQQHPVAAVVAVIGTTEEGAVDPVSAVLDLREECRAEGLDFVVHADAAWGGYFASLLRTPGDDTTAHRLLARPPTTDAVERRLVGGPRQVQSLVAAPDAPPEHGSQLWVFTPELAMSEHVEAQYRALPDVDSITVDPHKAGYIPYPAGALCYRNIAMRAMVAFSADVIVHGAADPGIGGFGVEGSKPGAAAAAAWLSHRVIRTDQSGYGRILGRCLFNSTRVFAELITMAGDDDPFLVKAVQRLPGERAGDDAQTRLDIEGLRRLTKLSNEELWNRLEDDKDAYDLFRAVGSDQIILSFAFNFRRGGAWNADIAAANRLNTGVFDQLSVLDGKSKSVPDLFVTKSKFDPEVYGHPFVDAFAGRLGLNTGSSTPLDFLIMTTMDPWLTDTADGNMIPRLIHALRQAVVETIEGLPANPADPGRGSHDRDTPRRDHQLA